MFSIYDLFTGEIKRVSETANPSHGEGFVEGEYSSATHYVKKGVVLELPAKLANEPVFDYLLERWVDVANLDTRRLMMQRGKLLSDSDWTQMPDVNLANKAEWAAYRQALRDMTLQPGYPVNVVWPVKPEPIRSQVFDVGSM